MAKKLSHEIQTGLFVLVCLVLLGLLVFRVGQFRFFEKRVEVKVLFDHTGGVQRNAPVRLAGVDVGKVKDIQIRYLGEESGQTKVEVALAIKPDARIRQDSKVLVSTLGLMGEKYIEITPGSSGSPFIDPTQPVVGQNPFQMEELVTMGKELTDNANKTMTEVTALAHNVNGMVVDNRQSIDRTFSNLSDTSENLKEFSADVRRNPWKLIIKTKEKKPEASSAKESSEGPAPKSNISP